MSANKSNWRQKNVGLPAQPRGLHLITSHVVQHTPDLARCRVGLLHMFLQHTSAALMINENADPDVPADLSRMFERLAPEDFPYTHTVEGPDDMPAHVKTALLGCSLTVPVSEGKLCLGTWQGIYLCEHRNRGGSRRIVLTLQGDFAD